MVIDACVALGPHSPILSIHDVGAGGLSNALPELVHDAGLGAEFELRQVESADKGMSPLQIWCCEAQERYVLAISEDKLSTFEAIANRERCGFSVVGRAVGEVPSTQNEKLVLTDRDSKDHPKPIDLPMSVLFGKPPKMTRNVNSRKLPLPAFDASLSSYVSPPPEDILNEAVSRVLRLPSVGSKAFLITIGDRTVTGLITRDQMVGPWQTPVSDVSVTLTTLSSTCRTGEAMAMGEKPALALISPSASAKMAVAESLLNIAAADIKDGLERVRLSANWMAAGGHPGEAAALYEAVQAIGMELCPELGVSIPVGKDSMSMKMKWDQNEVTAPVSLVVTAFSAVKDVRKTWTPQIIRDKEVGSPTTIVFVDLAGGKQALGGSAIAQVFGQVGNEAPTVRDPAQLKSFFSALKTLRDENLVLAYHDRSDGGLFTTIAEMAFAGRVGLDIDLATLIASTPTTEQLITILFNEELGAVFQIRTSDLPRFKEILATAGNSIAESSIHAIAMQNHTPTQLINILHSSTKIFSSPRSALQQTWASTSHAMQRLRDNPACADSEFQSILSNTDPGLSYNLKFSPDDPLVSPALLTAPSKPRVAILREQGINGHSEMAFAFHAAGFTPVDVHMTDLLSSRVSLDAFTGVAACGGFSYGDVLGAGAGWAKSVLHHKDLRESFQIFFNRPDTFTLGVCNGCQFLSRLAYAGLIPGVPAATDGQSGKETAVWPLFGRNQSEQYEARFCMLQVSEFPPAPYTSPPTPLDSPGPTPLNSPPQQLIPSVFLHEMQGSSFPIPTAHGEGFATFSSSNHLARLRASGLVCMRYVDNNLIPTEKYPYNPNGSPEGIAGVRSPDGRVLAMMPHPERGVVGVSNSFVPKSGSEPWEGGMGPWERMFRSARRWVG